MDRKKVFEVIGIYRQHLIENHSGIKKIDYPHDKQVIDKDDVLGHCLGMLDKMEKFVKQARMEKAFRWLGFIQGCLWSMTCYNLEHLKNHNRPTYIEATTPEKIREKRINIEEQIEALKKDIGDLTFDLRLLQVKCQHVDTRRYEMSGMATITCNDCGFRD